MTANVQESLEHLMALEDDDRDETRIDTAMMIDPDEALDEAAQGRIITSDDAVEVVGEIDAIGLAAGLVVRDDRPFRGIDEVERRDAHRWELDPASAEDSTAD